MEERGGVIVDPSHIAEIRVNASFSNEDDVLESLFANLDIIELCDALVASQEEVTRLTTVASNWHGEADRIYRERDRLAEENTRLRDERDHWFERCREALNEIDVWTTESRGNHLDSQIEEERLHAENERLASQVAALTTALETYRDARRAMVQAVQSGQVAPQAVASRILEAEALAGRVLAKGRVAGKPPSVRTVRTADTSASGNSAALPEAQLTPTEEPSP